MKQKTMAPRTGKIGCLYARLSDWKSGEVKGRSTDQQMQACLLAAKTEGFEIPEHLIFIEEDGCKGEHWWKDEEGRNPAPYRPQLGEMIKAIREGEVDAVFVWRTDRYYRGISVAVGLLDLMKENGVRLFTKNRDLAIHTASGYESAMTEACSNQAYREKISEDVTRDHAMLASIGELTHSPSMLGFRSLGRGSKAARCVPEEIDLIRSIFRWYTYGDPGEAPLSANAIAARCMERGLKVRVGARNQKVKYPDQVGVQDVIRILKNHHYEGQMPHDGKLFPTRHFDVLSEDGLFMGPVITPEDFALAEDLRLNAKPEKRDRRAGLLNGIVVCASCGRPMRSQSRSQGRSFMYCPYRQGRKVLRRCHGAESRSIILEELEEWVLTHLAPLLCAEMLAVKSLQNGDAVRRQLASAELELQTAIEQEGQKLAELMAILDPTQIAQIGSTLRTKREILQKKVNQLRSAVRAQERDSSNEFDLLGNSKSMIRLALQRSVHWITVTRQGIVVLTASGAYIGARLHLHSFGPKGYVGATIMPPTCAATMECRDWIKEPESFVEGARLERGRRGRKGTPKELLPDFHLFSEATPSSEGAEQRLLNSVYGQEDSEIIAQHADKWGTHKIDGGWPESLANARRQEGRKVIVTCPRKQSLFPSEIEDVLFSDELRSRGVSFGRIARRLNSEGRSTFKGKPFHNETVQRMVGRTSRYSNMPITSLEISNVETMNSKPSLQSGVPRG
jgi:DNA invertase Pin-like site-specific DNA recombinase